MGVLMRFINIGEHYLKAGRMDACLLFEQLDWRCFSKVFL